VISAHAKSGNMESAEELFDGLFDFNFFWVDPGQPIWPITQLLDRVNHQIGFQNYVY
jgi:pentatricopeptide repeat protein